MSASTDLRTPFFEAGLSILGEEGYAGLKQAPLCRAVGVTTGAFYHSFGSWRDYTTQLLAYWRQDRTTRLIEVVREVLDPVAQLTLLIDISTGLPHRAEAAIRVWSGIDPEVAELQAEVDAERLEVIEQALVKLGLVEDALSLAHLAMAVLVGFEQRPFTDPVRLRWSLEFVLEAAFAMAARSG